MLRTRTDLMRMAFYTALGLFPNACGGRTEDVTSNGKPDAVTGGSVSASAATQTPTSGATSSSAPIEVSMRPPVPADTFPHSNPVTSVGPQSSSPVASAPASSLPDIDGGVPAVVPSAVVSTVGSELAPSPDSGHASSECSSAAVDPVTGLARCDNGVAHRPIEPQCNSILPRAASGAAPEPFDAGSGSESCGTDADCVEHANGYCDRPLDGQIPVLQCFYGCTSDAECGNDQVCLCGSPVGRCVSASCRTDGDCAAGMLCAPWTSTFGVGCPYTISFSCQTPADECATDADCPKDSFGSFCSGEGGVRKCVEIPGLACGRPFLVAGRERLASLVIGSDWCAADLALNAAQLPSEQRELLGQGWADIALMEHASVAAFARFTLQLLHVGAPAALIASAQQAMLDETAHARACFTLASGFLGRAVSAGPLPVDHALDAMSLAEMVQLTIREGCVGETVAALEAAEAWAHTTVPEVKAVLGKIRVDELQHAELAWQFVRWAITTGGDKVRDAAASEFAAVAAEANAQLVSEPSAFDTLPFGLVSPALRVTLRAAALRDVVLPCAAAMLRVSAPSCVGVRDGGYAGVESLISA